MIEAHISKVGLDVPPDEVSHPAASRAWRDQATILQLDLGASGISVVIWATGFVNDFSWLDVPVQDAGGYPIQQRGVTSSAGLYFLGLRRMHKPKSGFLFGVGEDAAYLADHIAARARK